MGEGRRPIGVRVTVFSRPSSCSCATDEPSRTLSDAKRRRGSPLQPRHPSSLIPPPWRPGEPKELRGRLATRRRREQLGEREECGGILDSVGGYSSLGWVWPASLVPRPPRALPSRPQRAHRPQRIDAYPSNGPSQNFFPSPRLRYLPYTQYAHFLPAHLAAHGSATTEKMSWSWRIDSSHWSWSSSDWRTESHEEDDDDDEVEEAVEERRRRGREEGGEKEGGR